MSKKYLNTPKGKELGSRMQIVSRQPSNLKGMVSGISKKEEGAVPAELGCFKCNKCRMSCPVFWSLKPSRATTPRKPTPSGNT